MRLRIEHVSDLEKTIRMSRVAAAYLVGFVLLLAFSAGNAWSIAPTGVSLPHTESGSILRGQPYTQVPSSTNADQCLPLLKSIQTISPESALDRSQRTAGQIAALGLLFGVRFAPGPLERPGKATAETMVQIKVSPEPLLEGRAALAVAAYRDCRKNEALTALTREFRWAR